MIVTPLSTSLEAKRRIQFQAEYAFLLPNKVISFETQKLSQRALKDLRSILEKEIGIESVDMLNENELNKLGSLFLSIFSESLKLKIKKSI